MLMVLGMLFVYLGILIFDSRVNLSQDTADDICQQLTGNSSAIAVEELDGKLHCELPSYDATQNIIIKSNSQEGDN